jgi:hypothetical protein
MQLACITVAWRKDIPENLQTVVLAARKRAREIIREGKAEEGNETRDPDLLRKVLRFKFKKN